MDNKDYNFEKSWTQKGIKLGTLTIIAAMTACFFPSVYLAICYGAFPTWGHIAAMVPILVMVFGTSWLIEPITYSQIFGVAGTYLAVLSGSMTQMRLPASHTAQDVAEVERGSREADIISTLGIAGSVFMSVFILTVFIMVGDTIKAALPEGIANALKTLILPAMFGSMFASIAYSGWKVASIAFVVTWLFVKFSGFPYWALILIAVFGNLTLMRILYKLGLFGKKERTKQEEE